VWEPTPSPPSSNLLSFYDYLRKRYPFPEPSNATKDEMSKATNDIKDLRRNHIRTFTNENQPGHRFRKHYNLLLERLNKMPEGFSILPSFYETLIYFIIKQRRNVSVIFRTFGDDLDQVIKEFNDFCHGKHPLYPSVKFTGQPFMYEGNEVTCPNLVISTPEQVGAFYRNGEQSHLILGTTKIPPTIKEGLDYYKEKKVTILSTYTDIYSVLNIKNSKALAIRDYWNWWSSCQERHTAGKLLLIDPQEKHVRHIFFDDNIWFDRYLSDGRLIVDLRFLIENTAHKPETLTVEQMQKYLIQATPYEAILDPEYFIKQVNRVIGDK